MPCDVYMHTSPSGRSYIGWTSRGWYARWLSHVRDARHLDTPMARAIRKYGPDSFSHQVLEVCATRALAAEAERKWIAVHGTQAPGGYNATSGGEGTQDVSDETRAKRAAAWTPEKKAAACAKRSVALRGRPKPPEWRAKVSAAHTGKKRGSLSPEHQAALAATWTPERRAAAAARARGRVPSAETRAKLSAAAVRQHARARGEVQ